MAVALFLAACGDRDVTPTPVVGVTSVGVISMADMPEDVSSAAVQAASVPTWTSTPPPTVPPTPTPQPAIQPTPAPTMTAREQLDEGRRQLRLQDYARARQALTPLLDDAAIEQAMRWEALFMLARVDWEDGFVVEARASMERLLAELDAADPSPMFSATTHFLYGDILSTSGNYSEAIAQYWLFLDFLPDQGEIGQPRIARAYLALGDLDGAAAAYRRAADAITTDTGELTDDEIVARVLLLESLAQTYSSAGRYLDATDTYDEILSMAQKPYYRGDIQYRAGQALAAAGNVPGAVERWLAATDEAPESGFAYSALIELVNRDVAFDLFQRGMIDLYAGAWLPAINAFEAYLESASPTDDRYPNALLGVGQAYSGAENYAAAMPYFDRVIAEYPACDCVGEAWLGKAYAEGAAGDDVAARRIYRTFARDHADDPLAAEALWRSAFLALEGGQDVEAGFDFLTLADTFPESERAPASLYVVALGAFRKGLNAQAASTFARLQQAYPDYRWDAVAYWLGRAREANGEQQSAADTWQQLVERAPDIYYGVMAAQALRGEAAKNGNVVNVVPALDAPSSTLAGDDGSQAFAEAWLSDWLEPVEGEGELSALPPAVAMDTDLIAGRLLLDVGDRAEALAQLERLFRKHQNVPRILYPLLLELETLGAHGLSISAAARLLEFSPAKLVEDTPIFLQKFAYPRHFEPLVVQEALANGIDPNLYFSLIRQESLFEEGARSSAAAQGLAQIIPDTGAWVATRLGYPNYTNDLVYRPDVNLKFGAYYLAWARDYLDGNLISALVGYNAGPGNAERWRQLLGPDDTIYVELLEYSEPRTYIRAILSNHYHYTRLYGKQ